MADATNVELGVCNVTVDATDIGHTIGGCEFTYEPEWHEVKVDLYGSSVVRRRLIGEKAMLKVPMAEHTIANLAIGIPAGSVVGAGSERLEVGSEAGKSSATLAVAIVAVPVDSANDEHTITIYKGMVVDPITLAYVNDGERIMEVVFHAQIDESKSDGNHLFSIGDPSD